MELPLTPWFRKYAVCPLKSVLRIRITALAVEAPLQWRHPPDAPGTWVLYKTGSCNIFEGTMFPKRMRLALSSAC